MKALGIIASTFCIAVIFNACDGVIFSSTSKATGEDPVLLGEPPGVVPEFGEIVACNADLDLPQTTLDIVGCTTNENEAGVYLCRLPLDGVGQVETLCLTPDLAAIEVKDSCTCTIIDDGGDDHDSDSNSHDDDSSSSDDDSSDDYKYHSSTYTNDSDHKRHGGDCNSDDDSSDSHDDDSSDDGHGGGTEVCVPRTTVQYRLGNCADLF